MEKDIMDIVDSIDIVADMSNVKLPNPDLKNFYEDLKERTIWITSEVDESFVSYGRYILNWNIEDKGKPIEERKPIKIMLFCYGGDLPSCNHLIDMMLASTTPVYTYNMGASMSAGLSILLAGSKRYCLKRSSALIHSGSGGINGTAQQVFSGSENYKKDVDNMFAYIAERTNIPIRTLKKRSKDDWYLDSKEQLELGVVHKVIENLDDII